MVAHDVSVTVHGPHGLKLDGKLAPGEVLEIGNVTRKADLGFTFVVPHTMAQEHGGKLPIQVRPKGMKGYKRAGEEGVSTTRVKT